MIAKGVEIRELFTIDRPEEYRYVEFEEGVKVIGYSGVRTYIEIPEMIDGKHVVAIGMHEQEHPYVCSYCSIFVMKKI